jgi:predicted DNA-binding ribbon-helix-helix protein
MTLSVEVEPALEDSLKRIALRDGVSVETVVQRLLEQQFPQDRTLLSESTLLERISGSDTLVLRTQIKTLWEKRQSVTLADADEARLGELQEALNATNVDRWADIAELARRKNKPLLALAQELGLTTAEVH